MEAKVQHVYKVKTVATLWLGFESFEIPVEFTVKQMSWDDNKSVEKLIREKTNQASVELNWKKKHMSIEQIF